MQYTFLKIDILIALILSLPAIGMESFIKPKDIDVYSRVFMEKYYSLDLNDVESVCHNGCDFEIKFKKDKKDSFDAFYKKVKNCYAKKLDFCKTVSFLKDDSVKEKLIEGAKNSKNTIIVLNKAEAKEEEFIGIEPFEAKWLSQNFNFPLQAIKSIKRGNFASLVYCTISFNSEFANEFSEFSNKLISLGIIDRGWDNYVEIPIYKRNELLQANLSAQKRFAIFIKKFNTSYILDSIKLEGATSEENTHTLIIKFVTLFSNILNFAEMINARYSQRSEIMANKPSGYDLKVYDTGGEYLQLHHDILNNFASDIAHFLPFIEQLFDLRNLENVTEDHDLSIKIKKIKAFIDQTKKGISIRDAVLKAAAMPE